LKTGKWKFFDETGHLIKSIKIHKSKYGISNGMKVYLDQVNPPYPLNISVHGPY